LFNKFKDTAEKLDDKVNNYEMKQLKLFVDKLPSTKALETL